MKRTTALQLMLILAATGLIAYLSTARAEEAGKELTVQQIVDRANFVAYYQGSDGKARVSMTITDPQGRTRERELTILRWDAPDPEAEKTPKKKQEFTGKQKFLVYFHRPADVSKMTYLVHKHLEGDDDRWLYLPKLDLVKRIAGSEKRTSFVGSEFYYEDISGRNVDLDKHELLETTKNYHVLKNTPKAPDSVEFSYYKMWIHRKTFLVVKTVYYDKDGRAYRQYEAKAVKPIQDYMTITKSRMTDLRSGRYTDLAYDDVQYDLDLPEDIFTERYLRRPPMKYIEE
jgi:hypothetical protein